MPSRITCYLRRERRRWAFTQTELAFLFGRVSATHISRLENSARQPSARVVIASEYLFGIPAHELFPVFYSDIQESVLAQASKLLEALEGREGADIDKKKEILTLLLDSALTSPDSQASL